MRNSDGAVGWSIASESGLVIRGRRNIIATPDVGLSGRDLPQGVSESELPPE